MTRHKRIAYEEILAKTLIRENPMQGFGNEEPHPKNNLLPTRVFTLIELLIVIAIISILAAMLMPALSKARKKAQSTVCVNKIKQIGLGMMNYVDANNDYYPPLMGTSGYKWNRYLVNTKIFDASNWPSSDSGIIPSDKSVFLCPTDFSTDSDKIFYFGGYWGSYGVNYRIMTMANPYTTKITKVKKPSKTALMTESVTNASDQNSILFGKTDYSDIVQSGRYKHDGIMNLLFVDSHIQGLNRNNILKTEIAFYP